MDSTKFLKNIFDLANQGVYTNLDNLPDGISRDVVEKNILYIELKNLIKTNGDSERIDEIKSILNPPDEYENDVIDEES